MSAGGSPTPGGMAYPDLPPRWLARTMRQPRAYLAPIAETTNRVLTTLVTSNQAAILQVGVDWFNDGDITWTSVENVTSDVRQTPALVSVYGRDQARQYQPPRAARATFSLDNTDGTYASLNSGSPLFGLLNPGLLCRVRRSTDGGVTWWYTHTGYVDSPTEQPGLQSRTVDMVSYDALAGLKAATISTAELTSVTVDVAIGACLDAAGWPSALRQLATADTTLLRWCVSGIDAYTAIRDLVFTEGPGANLYVDPDTGKIVFENRHYRLLTSRCTTSQMTASATGGEPLFGDAFSFDPGVRSIVNSCTVPVNSYTDGTLATIWSGPTPISLAAGESRSYLVTTNADWFNSAVAPVAVTDYALSGTALASATLDRTSGKTATLTLTAGAGSATITGLGVRAQTVTIAKTYVSNSVSGAAATGVNYGVRTFPAEFVPSWLPDVNTAADYCNFVVSRYKDPVPVVQFSVDSQTAARLASVLPRKPSDRITVVEPVRTYLNADFFVEQITDSIASGGTYHQRVFACERASDQAFWVLGVAGYSELGSTTVLGY